MRLAEEPRVPHPAAYSTAVFIVDRGYVGVLSTAGSGNVLWKSRIFRTAAAAWRTLLKELMRRQGLD